MATDVATTPRVGQSRAAKNTFPFVVLLTGTAISMIGNVFAAIAIPWFVLQSTGSATQTGITGFFTVIPVVIAAFFGGSLVDRLGFKRASISADVTSGVAIALIPLLYHTVGLAFWQLLALVFVGNLLDAPGNTARQALIPDLAQLAHLRLERASAAIQAIERGSRLVGAPLAGFLIAVLGASNVLWIDAVSFLVSALLVAAAVPRLKIHAAPAPKKYLAGSLDALKFIWRDRVLLAIVLSVMVTNFLDAPSGAVILPVYAKQQFGSAFDLGLMFAAMGGGSLFGALVFGAIGHRLPRRLTFALMFVITGLRFWVLAAYPGLALVLVALVIAGIGAGPLNPIISTVEYERIPAHMRGRVFGAITAGAYMAIPLGMLLGGFAAEQIGIEWSLLVMGACYLVTTVSLLVNPALRDMDQGRSQTRELYVGENE